MVIQCLGIPWPLLGLELINASEPASGKAPYLECFSAMRPLWLGVLSLNVYCSPYVEMMPPQLHLINSYIPLLDSHQFLRFNPLNPTPYWYMAHINNPTDVSYIPIAKPCREYSQPLFKRNLTTPENTSIPQGFEKSIYKIISKK